MRSRWFLAAAIRGQRLAVLLIFCGSQMMAEIMFLRKHGITPSHHARDSAEKQARWSCILYKEGR